MEKYGEIPKRFTKAWWSYFWYYYKWHVFGIAVTIAVIAVTCVQCANREKYDVTVTYAGNVTFMPITADKIEEGLEPVIDDVDENGEKSVLFQTLNIAKEGTQQAGTEYNDAMLTKLSIEFQMGDTYLFLFNKQEIDRLMNRSSSETLFVPAEDWADADISVFKTAKQDGVAYAVNITDNTFFKETLGLDVGDDLYAAVRRIRSRNANDDKEKKMYSASVKAANFLLSTTPPAETESENAASAEDENVSAGNE